MREREVQPALEVPAHLVDSPGRLKPEEPRRAIRRYVVAVLRGAKRRQLALARRLAACQASSLLRAPLFAGSIASS